ncbi:IclR family transcriptional regulator [Burkholderia sp. Ac-20365]|uniref:IclR family transcriptional regulator n=1 Tax=Burkholderia sp. Ac-20365 TaxID=2703897 RepID=UPI00197B0AE6|nr:IclR family transcriptional regulator [Burkholderia sp. Ac-20365]MBN3763485.1 IclR family transcriptional regulator [Burkholderia sp. Ac-20365]
MSHIPAERCLDIIELLADGAVAMPLGEIATRLELAKSGAHRLLATLVDLGWAEQDAETGFYRLTMRLAILGQRYFVATGIPDICQPLLDNLARQSREFVRLAVVDGSSLTWVAHAQGATSGLLYQPTLSSNTVPLHATATGKVWLATLATEQAAENVLRVGFGDADKYGPNVIRSLDALLQELEATKRRGYGLAVNEGEPGVSAIAAAIRPAGGGEALGVVSVAGPSARMTETRVDEMAPLVMQAAAELASFWPLRKRSGQTGATSRMIAA